MLLQGIDQLPLVLGEDVLGLTAHLDAPGGLIARGDGGDSIHGAMLLPLLFHLRIGNSERAAGNHMDDPVRAEVRLPDLLHLRGDQVPAKGEEPLLGT